MSDSKEMFGWDLVYRLVENTITRKEEVIVVLIHWNLVKSGFKCLGIGNDTTVNDSGAGSEALPENWNKGESYALRYIYDNKLYILRGVMTEGDILFNLVRVPDLNISNLSFNVDQTVKNLRGPIDNLIPNYKESLKQIQKDLLDPVFAGINREEATQTTEEPSRRSIREPIDPTRFDPLRIDRPSRSDFDPDWTIPPSRDPLSVGRSDLDPFARGGGMLFNPFPGRFDPEGPPGIPGGLPRGAVPPGARFDPFGPPDLNPRGGPRPGGRGGRGRGFGAPDPDHLPPPGYEDMFM